MALARLDSSLSETMERPSRGLVTPTLGKVSWVEENASIEFLPLLGLNTIGKIYYLDLVLVYKICILVEIRMF